MLYVDRVAAFERAAVRQFPGHACLGIARSETSFLLTVVHDQVGPAVAADIFLVAGEYHGIGQIVARACRRGSEHESGDVHVGGIEAIGTSASTRRSPAWSDNSMACEILDSDSGHRRYQVST